MTGPVRAPCRCRSLAKRVAPHKNGQMPDVLTRSRPGLSRRDAELRELMDGPDCDPGALRRSDALRAPAGSGRPARPGRFAHQQLVRDRSLPVQTHAPR